MTEQKILKIKIGEVFVDGKNESVFQTAWKKTSKDGKTTYYEVRYPIFPQTVEVKSKPQGQSQQSDV